MPTSMVDSLNPSGTNMALTLATIEQSRADGALNPAPESAKVPLAA
jgi:hypothetical protein